MPVSRKPKEKDLEAFIAGGGSEPEKSDVGAQGIAPVEKKEDKLQSLKLRVPTDLLEEIDQLVAQRRPSPSRHQWILEALYEKVERENLNNSELF